MIRRRRVITACIVCAACDGEIQLGASSARAGDASTTGDDAANDAGASATPPFGSCATDGACRLETLHCDTARGACVECRGDLDCTSSDRRRCDPATSRCVSCRGDADCEIGKRCELTTHRCTDRCSEGRLCSVGTCESSTGRCIECLPGSACGDDKVCGATSVCVECSGDADCAASGDERRCDRLLGRCVECTSSTQCAPELRCDPASGECRTATSD